MYVIELELFQCFFDFIIKKKVKNVVIYEVKVYICNRKKG